MGRTLRSGGGAFRRGGRGRGRRVWVRTGAVAVAAAGVVALVTAPSQAIVVPPPGVTYEVIRIDYLPPDMVHEDGEHVVVPCVGQPTPPDWGNQTGAFRLVSLPCPPAPAPALVGAGS